MPVLVIAEVEAEERRQLLALGAAGIWPEPQTEEQLRRLVRVLDNSR